MASPFDKKGADKESSLGSPDKAMESKNSLSTMGKDFEVPESDSGDRMQAVQQEVQTLQKLVRALANEFPAGARDLKTAESALASASQAILASLDEASGEFSEPPPLP